MATPDEERDAAANAALIEPAAGTEVYIPVDLFLENLRQEPSFVETVVDRLLGLRSSIARALRALKADEVDTGVDAAREVPAPVLDVAQELGSQTPVGYDQGRELADRIRGAEATRADVADQTMLAAQDIGIKDSPTLGADFSGVAAVGLSSGGASFRRVIVDPRPPWGVLATVMDVLGWIRHQPLLTILAVSLLALLFWMRQAVRRAE
jgi:hypothetical protein